MGAKLAIAIMYVGMFGLLLSIRSRYRHLLGREYSKPVFLVPLMSCIACLATAYERPVSSSWGYQRMIDVG